MQTTPKGLRVQIGIFGRTNVGKSSLLNFITGQDVSITSDIAGTTTDVVEKTMELLPIGPVVFLDTAGLGDITELADERMRKTKKVYERSELIFLVVEADVWSEYESHVIAEARYNKTPVIVLVNKIDLKAPSPEFVETIKEHSDSSVFLSSLDFDSRDETLASIKAEMLNNLSEEFLRPPALIGDLVPAGGVAVLIVPIDLEAPKGRLILPQVQTIRDALDNDSMTLVVKEREYRYALEKLKQKPDIVVCDSQVVLKMVGDTPLDIPATTFSILFARYKGDIVEMARGAARLESLTSDDKILIAESCSHHAIEDDIGRVKIPRWIRQHVGGNVQIDVASGRDFPDNLSEYSLVVQCGGCTFNRKEILFRTKKAVQSGVAITNYGLCISALQGVIKRVLEPFPAALDAYEKAMK